MGGWLAQDVKVEDTDLAGVHEDEGKDARWLVVFGF